MTGPAPAVAAVRVAVRHALADLPSGSLVLVACSGGPDSLALAAGLAFVGPRAGLRAGAVVVDHALQAASDEVAVRAATACRALGLVPVVVRRVAVAGPGGPEAAAREARYAALSAVADETGAAAVLLGHTRDDQAETVLLGLARGSGPRSLAGMAPVAGPYRRPLLGIIRAQTLEACVAQGLEPWHDPTNMAGPNLRSRVRREAMPALEEVLGPGVAAALARTADLAREQADALDELAADLLARAAAEPPLPDRVREPSSTRPSAGAEWSRRTRPRGVSASEGSSDAPGAPVDGRTVPLEGCEGEVGTLTGLEGREGEGGTLTGLEGCGWDVGVLARAPDGLRRAALHAAALAAGATPGSLGRAHVLALDALVVGWRGQGPVALPGAVVGVRRCGRLFLQRGTTRE